MKLIFSIMCKGSGHGYIFVIFIIVSENVKIYE